MATSVRRGIEREWTELQRELEDDGMKGKPLVSGGIIAFCKEWLKLVPTRYQERILLDPSRCVAARWAGQTGKSTTLGARSLYSALHQGAKPALLPPPSLRQTEKLIRRTGSSIRKNPPH